LDEWGSIEAKALHTCRTHLKSVKTGRPGTTTPKLLLAILVIVCVQVDTRGLPSPWSVVGYYTRPPANEDACFGCCS
jgi:hypothetical protein